MSFIEFALATAGYAYVGFMGFWGLLLYSQHQRLGVSASLSIALGALLHWVGLMVLLIISFAKRYHADDEGSAYDTMSSWGRDITARPESLNANSWDTNSGSNYFSQEPAESNQNPVGRPNTEALARGVLVFASAGLTLWAMMSLTWFVVIDAQDQPNRVLIFGTGLELWVVVTLMTLVALFASTFLRRAEAATAIASTFFMSWWISLALMSFLDKGGFLVAMSKLFFIPDVLISPTGIVGLLPLESGQAWLAMIPASLLTILASFLTVRASNVRVESI